MTGIRLWAAPWLVAKTMALLSNIWCAITAMHHIGDQCMKEVKPLRNAENVIRDSMHFVEVQIIRMRNDPIHYFFVYNPINSTLFLPIFFNCSMEFSESILNLNGIC